MKNSNNNTTFIIIAGLIVLTVFSGVLSINLLPNYESKSYYVKVGEEMSAKIDALSIENNMLNIITSGDATEYCVKSTRTKPDLNNICWKKVENQMARVSVYRYKKYYIWIKDTNGNISSSMSINTD